jgi:hypothetical protein
MQILNGICIAKHFDITCSKCSHVYFALIRVVTDEPYEQIIIVHVFYFEIGLAWLDMLTEEVLCLTQCLLILFLFSHSHSVILIHRKLLLVRC